MKKIIGIDPGLDGAFVFLTEDGTVIDKQIMPKIGKVLDLRAISDILNVPDKQGWHIFIEEVHAIFGASAKSTFSFGFAYCAVQMAACVHNFKWTLVQPKKWQSIAYQGIPEMRKPSTTYNNRKGKPCTRKGGLKTKEMSLVAVKRLFPTIDLKASSRCRTPHKGIVDALLIAEYGRVMNNPQQELSKKPVRECPPELLNY